MTTKSAERLRMLSGDARIQAHWAAQLLAAAADTLLEKTPDDAHTNLGWNEESKSLVGRTNIRLNLLTLELVVPNGDAITMAGSTLEETRRWLALQLGKPITLRDYDMPPHQVATGKLFDANATDMLDLANWFSFGRHALSPFGEPRIWPHHFDMGCLIEIDGSQQSIGLGLSPGDTHFPQPYFYVNPYESNPPSTMPELTTGTWAGNWLGAVLHAEKIVESKQPADLVDEFLQQTVELFRGWY